MKPAYNILSSHTHIHTLQQLLCFLGPISTWLISKGAVVNYDYIITMYTPSLCTLTDRPNSKTGFLFSKLNYCMYWFNTQTI